MIVVLLCHIQLNLLTFMDVVIFTDFLYGHLEKYSFRKFGA